jgi:putative nucleotidyltransferase with HDIG domain
VNNNEKSTLLTNETCLLCIQERLNRNHDTQMVINSLLRLSMEDMSLDELLRAALDMVLNIPWLSLQSQGAIFLVAKESNILEMVIQNNLPHALKKQCARVPFGRCLCGRAALYRKIQFSNKLDDRHEIRYAGVTPHGHYCVPIIFANQILGVINLYVKEGHVRKQEEEEFLMAVSDTLAGMIIRKRNEEALKDSYANMRMILDGTVSALAIAAEKRDPYTSGHQQQVSMIAVAIAGEMGLTRERIYGIRVAAILHDLGKISVPAEILTKPGKLTDIEMLLMRGHCQAGYDILKNIPFEEPVAQFVLQHHERVDGSGYPHGLIGQEIMLEARILGVADVLEAMSAHRPYRPALGWVKALEEIRNHSGVLYDPDVVEAVFKIFDLEQVKRLDSQRLNSNRG